MTVRYDVDGKLIEVDPWIDGRPHFSFWPSPHMSIKNTSVSAVDSDGMVTILRYRCLDCEREGAWKEMQAASCLKPDGSATHEPCSSCGLVGICATNCGGILEALSAPGVYIADGTAGGPIN